ncbi:hypothetical protein BKA70DRAFT_32776 [Coprinopsis sp. MPI-PUGE-AT-0042]|nr:hypothetical protein BKA70DRAFT_32776 [Coprinopsis sp. MPI-PUGE-AT-0042]
MQEEDSGARPPNPSYKGRNGFEEQTFGPKSLSDPRQLTQALNKHDTALDVLRWKGRPIPTLAAMEKELKIPETPESVLSQIPELEKRHIDDLERLYDKHAIEGIKQTISLYRSTDETQWHEMEKALVVESKALRESLGRLDELHSSLQHTDPLLLPLAEEYSVLRRAHLAKIAQLREHAVYLKKLEESKFPETPEQLRSKPPDFQLKVARILHAQEPLLKDKYLNEYGWSSLHLKPLAEVYKKNLAFHGEITTMIMTSALQQPTSKTAAHPLWKAT